MRYAASLALLALAPLLTLAPMMYAVEPAEWSAEAGAGFRRSA